MFGSVKKSLRNALCLLLCLPLFILGYKFFTEYQTFKKIITNLKAETRVAEALVMESSVDELTRKYTTTIKFLEYDVSGKPLDAKYFTFKGNLIQFQTLVVRFDDRYIEEGHRMKGKSIHLFLKAFVLDGKNTEEFAISEIGQVPDGYKVHNPPTRFERDIWKKFWKYALDPRERERIGIKNAQVEAPGQVFVPGTIYTLILENDGGLRIDTRPIPEILRK